MYEYVALYVLLSQCCLYKDLLARIDLVFLVLLFYAVNGELEGGLSNSLSFSGEGAKLVFQLV